MNLVITSYNDFWMVTKTGNKTTDPGQAMGSWLDLVRRNDRDLLQLCRLDSFRGSGRGGQKRNKTSNAIRLTISDIAVTESASRSRAQNITSALRKLRLTIALSLSPLLRRDCIGQPFPDEIKPYLGKGVIRINPHNPLFPVFSGCVVDLFMEYGGKWAIVAEALGVSNSQLRRFVEKHAGLNATLKQIQLKSKNEGDLAAEKPDE